MFWSVWQMANVIEIEDVTEQVQSLTCNLANVPPEHGSLDTTLKLGSVELLAH